MSGTKDLKEKTKNGLMWAAFSNGAQQAVTMIIGIVLANILSVSDYGMVAMLTLFSIIATQLQDGGFYYALAVKKEATTEDFNSVFWFNILMSLVLYTLLFFAAPLIADFNHTPELTRIARVLFLGFIITGIGSSHAAYLYRNLLIKQKTTAQVYASLLSGIAGIIAAVSHLNYWSLVIMDLSYKVVYNILIWHASPWRPTFHIDLHPALSMFGFSSKLLATNMLNTINNQLLQSILGHFYPSHQVGQYSQANKWTTMGSTLLTGMVGNVAQPVLASVNEEEGRQLRIFRKMLRFTAMLSLPALFGLGLIAPEFIYLTIGEKWLPCVPYLQILCVAGAFIPLNQMFSNLLISKGQSNYYLLSTACFLALQLTAALTLYPYGIQQLLYAITSLTILWLAVWHYFAHRLVNITLWQTLKDILPFCGAALLAIAAAYGAASLFRLPLLTLCVKIAVAVLVYAAIMQLSGAEIWKECVRFMLEKIHKKQ